MTEYPSGLNWTRSTRCDSAACVEVASEDGKVYVRNSREPDAWRIEHDTYGWSLILDAIKFGGSTDEVVARLADVVPYDDDFCWRSERGCLHFSRDEMDAFVAGARDGEFDHAS